MSNKLLLAALVSVAFVNVASADEATTGKSAASASTGRRLNSLHTDKAVRHRRLLVSGRFEASPSFESTINPEFQHIVGGGLKLEYHLSDMLSIGAVGIGSTQFNTKLTDRIVPTLEDGTDTMTSEPSQQEFTERLNQMQVHGAAY